ncbi:uncharacterized protein LOC129224708 [Uloborus diversus]|uniref:uncharacterized protein LOC129224708 n=1 Tax=Uloborus diversus TaxID=327109 RepID=UPI00240A24A7|nr:uncharacterized protein LOC129224708 [Uloborus diversus]
MTRIMFIVLLAVFGCVFASPLCTNEEANKCIPEGGSFDFVYIGQPFADEDQLTEMCHKVPQQLQCGIDFINRCPNTPYVHFKSGLISHKNIYAALCDRSNQFRAKYLKHISCINEKIVKMDKKCMEHINFYMNNFKCTTAISNYKTCVEEVVQNECGEQAVEEVFRTLYSARTDINLVLCKQTYKQLKDFGLVSY